MFRSVFRPTPLARLAASPLRASMLPRPQVKYRPADPVFLPDRHWPNNVIRSAPRWCAVDLRDGNQSLVNPMTVEQKARFFELLLKCGFKEIEVGFPSASETDFDFVRSMCLGNRVPDDVSLQVLSPAREDLIRKTMDAVKDAKSVIFHMYNATSPLFRQVVFNNTKAQTVELARRHTELVRELTDAATKRGDRTQWQFEYSPETFTQTEPEFAVEVCEAVKKAWFQGKDMSKVKPIIFNLPATVEVATPNVYADQIEYFHRHITDRHHVQISLHTHNDRGTGIAATELGLMAGADRIEGCLFGNGERTGNVDLVAVALNMYAQGIHPNLDFSDINNVIRVVTECNNIPVHPRHPYAGELVFTAFSGSHQDAIKKGFASHKQKDDGKWSLPYLLIDPHDIGCDYEAVIRVNSQSGKGGVAYLIQEHLGFDMPRRMQQSFYAIVQEIADRTGREMTVEDLTRAFCVAYHFGKGNEGRFQFVGYTLGDVEEPVVDKKRNKKVVVKLVDQQQDGEQSIVGYGNGPLSATLDALKEYAGIDLSVSNYTENSMGEGSDVKAASYVEVRTSRGRSIWGLGIDEDVTASSLKAVLSAASTAASSEYAESSQVLSKSKTP